MAIDTPTVLDDGSDTTDASSYATPSISPTGSALVLAFVVNGRTDGTSSKPTGLSGNGLTWVEILTGTTPNGNVTGTLYRAMGASPSSGAVTISFSGTQHNCAWHVIQATNVDTSGTNGSGAVVQAQTETPDTDQTPEIILNNAIGSGNASLGFFVANSTSATWAPGSGYTRLGTDNAITSPTLESLVEYDVTGTTTVNADYAQGSGKVYFGIEVADNEGVNLNVGLVSSPATALTIDKTISKTLGLVSDVDVALPISRSVSKAVGLAQTTDVALPITVDAGGAVDVFLGVASSGNVALPLTVTLDRAVGLVQAGNTALAISKVLDIPVGLAVDVDVALPITVDKTINQAVGLAQTVDVALPLGITVQEILFTFQMPRYTIGNETRKPLFRYYKTTVADSLVRRDGVLTTVRTPHSDWLQGLVEGRDYFLGGRIYSVTNSTRLELAAAGYSVEE